MPAQTEDGKRDRVLNIRTVTDRTNLSRRTIYTLIKEKKFPEQVKLSPRRVGWMESHIQGWIESKITGAAA